MPEVSKHQIDPSFWMDYDWADIEAAMNEYEEEVTYKYCQC